MTEDEAVKELGDGEWEDVYTAKEVSQPWEPMLPTEGTSHFFQIGKGKFIEYLYENGRFNFVGEVTND